MKSQSLQIKYPNSLKKNFAIIDCAESPNSGKNRQSVINELKDEKVFFQRPSRVIIQWAQRTLAV